ncbi:MAG: cytochrome C, partial [Candidatus Promineifilaceae bacterium]
MRDSKYVWVIGLVVTFLLIVLPIVLFSSRETRAADDPWSSVPQRVPSTDHSVLMKGPFETGEDVTEACLECHEDAGHEMLGSVHWTWESEPVMLPGRDEP